MIGFTYGLKAVPFKHSTLSAVWIVLLRLSLNQSAVTFTWREEQIRLQPMLPGVQIEAPSLHCIQLLAKRVPRSTILPCSIKPESRSPAESVDNRCAIRLSSAPAPGQFQSMLDHRLRLRTGELVALIQNQDPRLCKDRPRNRNPSVAVRQGFTPRSRTMVAKPSGNRSANSSTARRYLARPLELARPVESLGPREHHILADGSIEQKRVLQHHTRGGLAKRLQLLSRTLPRSLPSTSTLPLPAVWKAQDQAFR